MDLRLLKKLNKSKQADGIKTWSRACTITPEMVGFTFLVHNGKEFTEVKIREEMVAHRMGEFSPTTRFSRHGGKMQREIEQKQSSPGVTAPAVAGRAIAAADKAAVGKKTK